MRGTRSSTLRAQILSRRTVPRTAFGPAWSGFRVQGTADSPPSVTGQAEGTTSPCEYNPTGRVIEAVLYTDAGCPWAYSANPALRVLEWRFREQLSWRLVMVGLREEPSEAAVRTYDSERALARWRVYEERYGMPFATEAKPRPSGTGRGCRAVIAAGILDPGTEWTVFRSLQLGNFTSSLLLDEADSIRDALRSVSGVDADRIASMLDEDYVLAEYERQRAAARTAAGTPADAQGKTAASDGTRPLHCSIPGLPTRRARVRRRRVAAAIGL